MGVNGLGNMKSAGSTSLRGQMGLRSGPLAPTSAKLTTQYLVLDHMTSHYNKIAKAKPGIDNRPPKSMSTSQKARDRKTRDHVAKTGQRPTSAMMSRSRRPHTTTGYYQDDIYDENLWGEVDPEDEEETLIHNIMRTTLRGNSDPTGTASQAGYNDGNFENTRIPRQRPSSARSHRSMASGISRTMVGVQKKGTYDGDLLQKRSHVFTEEKPFTPRTLKTDRKSRLGQYKYYNKVPPKGAGSTGHKTSEPVQDTRNSQGPPAADDARPQPKPRQRRLDQTREGPVTMNSLMFETLHSRDFDQGASSAKDHDVPKLDISMDTDHLKWVKEQASRAEDRSGNRDTLKSSIQEESGPLDQSVDFGKTGEMSLTYGSLGSTKTRPELGSRSIRSKEDEEQAYVKFMHDVTSEVLNRGIYTDRSLRQVFKVHINQNKGKLDELRMRQITDEIRQELNIPRYDIDDDTSYTMTKEDGLGLNLDLALPDRVSKLRGQGHSQEADRNGTLEMSMQSRASKVSTEQSHDTYNFKSTEDDELFSTIRSDGNNTLSDMQALKTYQTSIQEQEQEEFEEGEIIEERQRNGEVASEPRSSHRDEEDEEEDYDDDDYEDDGDDEDDDGQQTTEPTATYRTDDDDF